MNPRLFPEMLSGFVTLLKTSLGRTKGKSTDG